MKMIIVVRKDLKMRRGKEIAQACHGAIDCVAMSEKSVLDDWTKNHHKRKICLQVDSEAELWAVYKAAQEAGLVSSLVEDLGLTEFDGLTKTALVLGPANEEKLNSVTGALKLY